MSPYRQAFVAGFFLFFVVFVVGGALMVAGQFGNLGGWPYWRVLPLGLAATVGAAFATVLLARLLPERWRAAFVGGLQALTIIAFATTVLLPKGVERLDGDSGVPPNLLSLGLMWAAYLAIAFVFVRFLRGGMLQRLFAVAATIGVVTVLGVTVLFATSSDSALERLRTSSAPVTDLYEFGSRRNVVVVLMDMLQGSFVEQTLAGDAVVREKYRDFTSYTRAVSTFPFTNYSLPTILSGRPYASQGDKRFVTNLPAAVADSFLADGARAGYLTVGVQSVPFLPVAATNIPAFEIPDAPDGAPLSYEGYFFKNYAIEVAYGSLMRVLKMDFRSLLGWREELGETKRSSRRLLERWAAQARVGKAENKLFFVHNFVTHSPIAYDRQGRRLLDTIRFPWSHPNLLQEIAFSLDLAGGVFDRMKALGVYDDALIIIVGDHGHFMGYYDPKVYEGVEDFHGYKTGRNFRPATMYNPVMMVKPPRSKQGGVSHAAVGLVDVRAIVDAYLEKGRVDVGEVIAQRRAAQPIPVVTCTEERNAYFSDECHRLVHTTGNASSLPALFEGLE